MSYLWISHSKFYVKFNMLVLKVACTKIATQYGGRKSLLPSPREQKNMKCCGWQVSSSVLENNGKRKQEKLARNIDKCWLNAFLTLQKVYKIKDKKMKYQTFRKSSEIRDVEKRFTHRVYFLTPWHCSERPHSPIHWVYLRLVE